MRDRFDLVAVRIAHEGGIVVWMIVRPQAGRAIASSACREGCRVERIHRGPVGRTQRDVDAIAGMRCAFKRRMHPELGEGPGLAERGAPALLKRRDKPQRGQCGLVEGDGARGIADGDRNMIQAPGGANAIGNVVGELGHGLDVSKGQDDVGESGGRRRLVGLHSARATTTSYKVLELQI